MQRREVQCGGGDPPNRPEGGAAARVGVAGSGAASRARLRTTRTVAAGVADDRVGWVCERANDRMVACTKGTMTPREGGGCRDVMLYEGSGTGGGGRMA